jgi:hypothetical protein
VFPLSLHSNIVVCSSVGVTGSGFGLLKHQLDEVKSVGRTSTIPRYCARVTASFLEATRNFRLITLYMSSRA